MMDLYGYVWFEEIMECYCCLVMDFEYVDMYKKGWCVVWFLDYLLLCMLVFFLMVWVDKFN